MSSSLHLVAYAIVVALTVLGVVIAPRNRRHLVGVSSIVFIAVIALMQPAAPSGFTTNNPTSTTLAIPETFQTPSQPAAPTGLACQWTGSSTAHLSWSAAAHTNGDVYRNSNGGGYADIGQGTADGSFTYDDTGASTGASHTYGYEVYASYGSTSWDSATYAGPLYSNTCKDTIMPQVSGTLSAPLNNEYGIAYDSSGNLFIADTGHNRIRMIPKSSGTNYGIAMTAGYIYTIAGDGTSSSANDGNLNTDGTNPPRIAGPRGVAVDQYGNVFIADTGNNAVRILWNGSGSSPTYNIATNYGGAPVANHLYTIWGALGSSGDGTGALAYGTTGKLQTPQDVAIDSHGDVFVADLSANKVKELSAQTTGTNQFAVGAMTQWYAYTIAGTGTSGGTGDGASALSAKLSSPQSVAVNSSGDVFISDRANNEIRAVSAATNETIFGVAYGATSKGFINGIVNTAQTSCGTYSGCGDGAGATSAKLNAPYYLSFDPAGNLLVSDQGDSRVRVVFSSATARYGISPTANFIYLLAGTGAATYTGDGYNANLPGASATNTPANIGAPYGIAADPTATNVIAVADNGKNLVREIETGDNVVFTIAGRSGSGVYGGDAVPAYGAEITAPYHGSFDSSGNYYFADPSDNRIREWVKQANCSGTCPGGGIVKTVAGSGSTGGGGNAGAALLANVSAPDGVFVDSNNNLYIAATSDNQIRMVVRTTGTYFGTTYTAGTVGNIYGIAGSGTACTSSCGTNVNATSAKLKSPQDVAVDSSGNLIISDTGTCQIRVVFNNTTARYGVASPTVGNIYTIAGQETTCTESGTNVAGTSATLASPDGITLDASNNIYVADSAGFWVRKINASDGKINTFTGNGGSCANVDETTGTLTSANFCGPTDVAWDTTTGALYVADYGNKLIRCASTTSTSACGQLSSGVNYTYTLAGSASTSSDTGNNGPSLNATVQAGKGIDVLAGGDVMVDQSATNADIRHIIGPDP
jgi:sugar lactone lactonase YvrE